MHDSVLKNFTVIDIVGSIEATLVLTLFIFVPGYVIGWFANVFLFRRRRLITQLALSSPLAVALVPILGYVLGRSPKVLWAGFGCIWVAFVFLVGHLWRRFIRAEIRQIHKSVWVAALFGVIWAIVAIASLVDLQFKDRLYFSVPAYDYSLRTAFTAAAAKEIPPANPFFFSSPPVALRYHYFWMLLCSLVVRLGHIGPRQAMYGGTVWAGIVLMSLIALCLRFFIRARECLERKVLIGCGLLLVTGLDILPTLYLYLRMHTVTPDMEWWNEQITSWTDALLWTPHHIMSLVACMIGFLLVRERVPSPMQKITALFVAGLAFASAAGLSVLVAFTFAVFVLLWLPFAAMRRWWDDVFGFALAGAVALLVALPYLRTLMGQAVDGTGGGGRFLAVSVRGFPLGVEVIASMFGTAPTKLLFLAFPLLPLNYFLELGFFFVIGIWRIRSIRAGTIPLTREEESAWMMVFTSFLIGTFLRSTTIGSNDLGWRCFLLAQLILLLWAAIAIDKWRVSPFTIWQKQNAMVLCASAFLVIGVIGTTYQVIMLRIYPVLHDEGKVDPTLFPWLYEDQRVGERTYALRSAYEQLAKALPSTAVVQYNPNAPTVLAHELYSGHDAVVGLPLCGAVFGGDPVRCKSRMQAVAPIFEATPHESRVDDVCFDYGISVILADDTDAIWKRHDSWLWTRKPIVANNYVRAIACGASVSQQDLRSARN